MASTPTGPSVRPLDKRSRQDFSFIQSFAEWVEATGRAFPLTS